MATRIRRPRYIVITGDFYILYPDLPRSGPEPDGDTINFLPDEDDLVENLPRFNNVAPERKHLGTYSVRFEGIDALETHFLNRHQDLQHAEAARDRMLQVVGFRNVRFRPENRNKVLSVDSHPLPGYLLANGIEANGRVLGLVYTGAPDAGVINGERQFVDEAKLEASVNAALVREGLAYAELYSTMPFALIKRLRQLVKAARQNGAGLWTSEDLSKSTRIPLAGLQDLPQLVMFPKLYRRLVKYFDAGFVGLGGFDSWIRADPKRDDRALLPTGEMGNLHDLYDVGRGGIKLQYFPEDLTFQPDVNPVP